MPPSLTREEASVSAQEVKRLKRNEYAKRYYERNRERIKRQVKERAKRDASDPLLLETRRILDRERTRRWRERHPERARAMVRERMRRMHERDPIRARHAQYRHYYGLEPEQYAAMLAQQSGLCAICSRPPPEGTLLHVDHDHETGKVRGLLCRGCNSGIGFFRESEGALQKAITYLRAHGAAPK